MANTMIVLKVILNHIYSSKFNYKLYYFMYLNTLVVTSAISSQQQQEPPRPTAEC